MRGFAPFIHGHFLPVYAMPPDRFFHRSALQPKASFGESQVDFGHFPTRKLLDQGPVRDVIFGRDQAAARLFIETMHDARTFHPTDPAQLVAMVEKGIDDCPVAISDRGMHDQPRRFIDHDQICVFIEDGQRNILGQDLGRLRGRLDDMDLIAPA